MENHNTKELHPLAQSENGVMSMENRDESIFCMNKGEEETISTSQRNPQINHTYQHCLGQRANKGNEEKHNNDWLASHWVKLVCFMTVVLVLSVAFQSWNKVTKTRQYNAVFKRESAKLDDLSMSPALLTTTQGFAAKSESSKEDASPLLCDELLLGAWVETCFFAETASTSLSNGNAIFPGMQGMLSYPIIIVTPSTIDTDQKWKHDEKHDIQFHLYGYSLREPFFDAQDYLEWGEGQHSRVQVPSETHHCVATFKSRLMVGQDNWSFDQGDYFWNALGEGQQLMSGNGKNVACFFRRLYGSECRQVRQTVIEKFELFTNLTDMNDRLPSEQSLCN